MKGVGTSQNYSKMICKSVKWKDVKDKEKQSIFIQGQIPGYTQLHTACRKEEATLLLGRKSVIS